MVKKLVLFFLVVTFSFAKECYFNKADTVCYYKYFDRSKIYDAKADENYYTNKFGHIYTFDDTIEVRFNSMGAVFTLINDYELEFVDKISKSMFLFKVQDRSDLFPMLSKLNHLKTVMKAQPHRKRKFTKSFVAAKRAARQERIAEAKKEAMQRAEVRAVGGSGKFGNQNVLKASGIKGSFLNPDGD